MTMTYAIDLSLQLGNLNLWEYSTLPIQSNL